MSPAMATGWYLWRRIRLTILCLLGAIALLAAMTLLPDSLVMRSLIRSGSVLTVMGLLSLIVAFAYEGSGAKTPAASGGSNFPVAMLVLPVKTKNLVLWPVAYATFVQLGVWTLFATLVLRPQGITVNLAWPAFAMLGFTTTVQTSTWAKFPVPMANIVYALSGMGIVAFLAGAIATGTITAPFGYGALFFLLRPTSPSVFGDCPARG